MTKTTRPLTTEQAAWVTGRSYRGILRALGSARVSVKHGGRVHHEFERDAVERLAKGLPPAQSSEVIGPDPGAWVLKEIAGGGEQWIY